jgi:hypothetical protein
MKGSRCSPSEAALLGFVVVLGKRSSEQCSPRDLHDPLTALGRLHDVLSE